MTSETFDWAPVSCTLPTVERPLREKEFATLFTSSLTGVERVSPVTARLVLAPESAEQARDLAARESDCCSFFTFEVHAADSELVMSITVPAIQIPVLDALADFARRAAGLDAPRS